MKFTFKKHKIKVLMIDLIIIALFIVISYFCTLIDSSGVKNRAFPSKWLLK